MTISELIDPMLPSLNIANHVEEVLHWMDEYEMPQLPVVEDNRYLGMVSKQGLLESGLSGVPLAHIHLEHTEVFAWEHQHILEVLGIALRNELKVVPVLDTAGEYLGSAAVFEVFEKIGESIGAYENGAILVLKVKPHDYSLSEISRLVESNNAKIITSFYGSGPASYHPDVNRRKDEYNNPESELVRTGFHYLTIKLNQVNVAHIRATFERFGYDVTEVFASEPMGSIDQDRLDHLMRYLET